MDKSFQAKDNHVKNWPKVRLEIHERYFLWQIRQFLLIFRYKYEIHPAIRVVTGDGTFSLWRLFAIGHWGERYPQVQNEFVKETCEA
jgi:hypothetical protein